ncbi:transposase, partial [Pseudonocardia sp. EV170527-09]|uniref:IS1634 family transposase n=1 Tax=Pseudonocardia sp. EV170527-09 TaxID=2603411 RepID=UPI001F0078FE
MDESCYRAMDWLIDAEPELGRIVFDTTADLLNLEVDLLFFDTTSTYFETADADEPVGRDEHGMPVAEDDEAVKEAGFRTFGKSKDSRPDLPQIVVGMAVTRDGIPVRCWAWPGNTADSALIRQVKDDMRDWSLSRIVWVADRGFTSAENRRYLQRAGGHYILGEKLRGGTPEADAALSRQGRYRHVADNLQVKEVRLASDLADDRFVICFNPEAALRDAAIRDRMVALLVETIAGSDKLSNDKRAELRGVISTKPGLKRYLRTTPGGLLRIDKKAIDAEANLDGKFLLRCSDPKLSAEDIALGYKQLLQVERGWRDMKSIIDMRPVYHRVEDRIRAHVLLCWLALLLIRIAETKTGQTWAEIR